MQRNSTRTLGTILMGTGLLLILIVSGYFAWTEVQASQVRTSLEENGSDAAARLTRVAQVVAAAAMPTAAVSVPVTGQPAEIAAASRAALTATRRPVLNVPTRSAGAEVARVSPSRTPRSTATTRPTGEPIPSPTAPPAAAPTAVPTPVLPVRMSIPALKIDAKVVEMGWEVVQTRSGAVSQWVIPKNMAGHHLNSAGIGQGDNIVISGHNNIYGRVFMPISQAWNNDGRIKVDDFTDRSSVLDGREIRLFDGSGKQYHYVITDFYRLKDTGVSQKQREANGRYILPTGDERLTIITCWPPTNNTHRLVVVARPAQ